jgi:PKHD-type hydroxylase
MNRTIAVIKEAFDSSFCDKVFEQATNLSPAKIYEGNISGREYDNIEKPNMRRSETQLFTSIVEYKDIFLPVIELIHSVNKEHYGFNLVQPELMQYTQYGAHNQGMFTPHRDDINYDITASHTRKLSISIQLSDENSYEGGDLVFPENDELDSKLLRGKGTAIVFPSYVVHGVSPVTSGVRHSLVSWFIGAPFK